jgi:hypothetical protein
LSTPRPTAFKIKAADVKALHLHVCRDPLSSDKAGAGGHCLVANVYDADEKVRRSLRAKVIKVSVYDPEGTLLQTTL